MQNKVECKTSTKSSKVRNAVASNTESHNKTHLA